MKMFANDTIVLIKGQERIMRKGWEEIEEYCKNSG